MDDVIKRDNEKLKLLKKYGMRVKVYRDACQTVLIAMKGAAK